jgi:hypothetical protein
VFSTHRIFRSALCATIACAALATTATGAALAAADPLAQERYYASHATPSSAAALAQEQHYSSYGDPEPLALDSAAPAGESPSLPIALALAGALVIVAASATQLHRLHTRRRRATA